jgi:hypothetical protein
MVGPEDHDRIISFALEPVKTLPAIVHEPDGGQNLNCLRHCPHCRTLWSLFCLAIFRPIGGMSSIVLLTVGSVTGRVGICRNRRGTY